MQHNFGFARACFALAVLFSASSALGGQTSAPVCKMDKASNKKLKGNAGCLIAMGQGMVLVRDKDSKRLGPPGGTAEKGELAACTAHRETWEETGLNVTVSKHLKTYGNGFHLFECRLVKKPQIMERFPAGIALPEWAKNEIAEIQVSRPGDLTPSQMRFPKQLKDLKELYPTLTKN